MPIANGTRLQLHNGQTGRSQRKDFSEIEVDGEYQFERRMFASNSEQLRSLARWLLEQEVEEVVMESTAQYSHRSRKGNRHMRRVLNQTANAAARTKGSIFEMVYRRSVPRLGHNQPIGAIAHRQCRLIWLILHQGVRYEERGPAVRKQSKQKRTARMIRQLTKPRLSDRSAESSTQPSTSAVIFEPARRTQSKRRGSHSAPL